MSTHQYHSKGLRPAAVPRSIETTRARRVVVPNPQKEAAWLERWEREFSRHWLPTPNGYIALIEVKR